MKKTALLIVIFLIISGCTDSDGKIKIAKTFTDEEYFTAAKSYLTYNETFGAATDLSHPNIKKIEFHSLPPHAADNGGNGLSFEDWDQSYGSNRGKTGEIATVRKSITVNVDNNLMQLKRILPSRQDETTMTVGIESGVRFTKPWDSQTNDWSWTGSPLYSRSYETFQCDRVVFNATGQGACLKSNGSSIVLVKLSQKFGHRIVTACSQTVNTVSCRRKALFSPKTIDRNTGVITLDDLLTGY